MRQLSLAYALGLGMVALFNPCGFAMLPAYIGFFLGGDAELGPRTRANVRGAVAVTAAVTGGFLAVFVSVGLTIQLVAQNALAVFPWLSIGIGLVMLALASARVAGRKVRVPLPWAPRGPRDRRLRSMFGFGVGYALVSCACTLPLFLATVVASLTSGNVIVGSLHLAAYGFGMGLVLLVLTLALTTAQVGLLTRMRRVLPLIDRASAVLLAAAGVYVIYYGWHTLRVYAGDVSGSGPADLMFDASARLTEVVQQVGPVRGAIVLTATAAVAAIIGMTRPRRPEGTQLDESVSPSDAMASSGDANP